MTGPRKCLYGLWLSSRNFLSFAIPYLYKTVRLQAVYLHSRWCLSSEDQPEFPRFSSFADLPFCKVLPRKTCETSPVYR